MTRREVVTSLAGALAGCAAWLALPVPGHATRRAPSRLVVLAPSDPESSWLRGCRLGLEEAERLVELLDAPLETAEARPPAGEAGAFAETHAREGASVLVAAFPDPHWESVETAAARGDVLLLDARPTHPPDAACSPFVFRVGVPRDGRGRADDAVDTEAQAAGAVEDAQAAGAAGDAAAQAVSPDRPQLWHESLFRYGATQLNERFRRRFGTGMDEAAWAGWFSVKAGTEALLRAEGSDPEAVARFLTGGSGGFDGHKGRPLRFRASDHRLVQPLYVVDSEGRVEETSTAAPKGEVCRAPDEEARDGGPARLEKSSLFGRILLLLCLAVPAACGAPDEERSGTGEISAEMPLVYVSNEDDGTVSVIDAAGDSVVRTIAVGTGPRGIHVAADARRLYVALSDLNRTSESDADAIAEVDPFAARVTKRYRAGSDPEQFALDPPGRRLYAANEDAGTASIIDLEVDSVLRRLPVGIEPEGVAVSPDGRWAYVAAETSNTVSVIDTGSNEIVASFLVDVRPRGVAFGPEGDRAYVSNEISGTLSVVDVAAHEVVETIAFPSDAKPVGVAVSPDGSRVFVAGGGADEVFVVDVAAGEIVGRVPVGERPWGVALSADGSRLYTANGVSNDVSVVDVETLRELHRIPVGRSPWGVTVSHPDRATGARVGEAG